MNNLANQWSRLGFGARMAAVMISVILGAIVLLTSITFNQYRNAQLEDSMGDLHAMGESNEQSFTDWLQARQDEMRFLARLEASRNLDADAVAELMFELTDMDQYYDTIFLVGTDGIGVASVDLNEGDTRIMPTSEANAFDVADREWFQSAVSGNPTFSQPVVSRATGNTVSTVAIPVYDNNEIVAVMRGAVMIDTLVDRVNDLDRPEGTEIFLVDGEGVPVTPAASIANIDAPLDTQAGDNARGGDTRVGDYVNAAGVPVLGSSTYIPMLDWTLVLETDRAVALTAVNQMMWFLIVLSVIVIAAATAICLLMVRSVLRTLGGDPAYAAEMVHLVAEGDLTADIALKPGDSTSLLASIRSMQVNLQDMMRNIGDYSDQVASSATELAQISEQSQEGVQKQGEEIDNSATAMNEMTSTLEEVAQNTQSSADASRSARDAASNGRDVVKASVAAISALADEVERTTEAINTVKADSDRIGKVVEVIEGIAEQTNLLALNAAIEAARAGESGRGFAVVADEVRGLAGRSKTSTSEIQTMIEQLQRGTEQAVNAMESSRERSDESVSRAREVGEQLEQIVESVGLIDETAQQIASATEQQTAVSRDINKSLHNISSVSAQTSDNVKQSVQASDSLSKLAEQLHALVGRFRLR